jgi:hypothetical protein
VPPPQFGGDAYFFVDAEGLERFNVPRGSLASSRPGSSLIVLNWPKKLPRR